MNQELLSEVMGSDVYLKQEAYEGFMEHKNIYELAHKNCIEWALSKGYNVNILMRNNGLIDVELRYGIDFDYVKTFCAKLKTLQLQNIEEAIFESCKWILKQKDNK